MMHTSYIMMTVSWGYIAKIKRNSAPKTKCDCNLYHEVKQYNHLPFLRVLKISRITKKITVHDDKF